VPQNYAEAMKWVRRAAEQGDANGQHILGHMYEDGHGALPDYAAALAWYRKAADQGNADAQADVGFVYLFGEGVPQDYGQSRIASSARRPASVIRTRVVSTGLPPAQRSMRSKSMPCAVSRVSVAPSALPARISNRRR
jgi:Sel1 repeat